MFRLFHFPEILTQDIQHRPDELVAVREHIAEVSLLRGFAGHQGQVLGDGLQAARPLPGPQVHRLRVGLGLAVESDIVSPVTDY